MKTSPLHLAHAATDFREDPIAPHVEAIVSHLGEDARRPGMLDTPKRFAKAMRFLTSGYELDPESVVGNGIFAAEGDGVVIVRDVEFYSLCEHHLLPFFGVAHVAYLPQGRVVGLSKIPRLVDVYAHRLQLQERMTRQIAEALEEVTRPGGVAVVVEARHLCIEMRGVEKGGQTVTSCMLGCFRDDARSRAELLQLIRPR